LTASSFDRELFHEIGTAIGTEARAMSKYSLLSLFFETLLKLDEVSEMRVLPSGLQISTFSEILAGPSVFHCFALRSWLNRLLSRRGRGHETPGEDPLLNGEYAKAFVSGMQKSNESSYLRVSACCKVIFLAQHF
jgi:hypothetical protein